MKLINFIPVILFFLFSCNESNPDIKAVDKVNNQNDLISFFPVTDFLKGQIAEIKKKSVNPLKITKFKNHLDSIWLKMEVLDNEFASFLIPEIDSTNLTGLFSEKRFLDQTIDAFTFTYDPKNTLPDSFLLRRWDVYIDPKSNTVKRIYMIKETQDQKTLQLTWQTNKNCRIISIASDLKGNDFVEKEVTIKWDY